MSSCVHLFCGMARYPPIMEVVVEADCDLVGLCVCMLVLTQICVHACLYKCFMFDIFACAPCVYLYVCVGRWVGGCT